MLSRSCILSSALALASFAACAAEPAHRVLDVTARHRDKPLQVHLFYPSAEDGPTDRVGANPLFTGVPMQSGAAPEPGRHPLVLLSHGSGGNAANLAWLGAALAREGYIVAAPNHPGTTSGDSTPTATVRVWERPADLSAAVDGVLSDPVLAPAIDAGAISVAGFSLGGFAALASVGATLDAGAYAAYCDRSWPDRPLISECAWLKRSVDLHRLDPRVEASMRDARFKRAVLIDPGLIHAASQTSLRSVSVPVTIVSLGDPGSLPPAVATERAVALLPDVRQAFVTGAIHFSALGECRPNGREILVAEGETDPLCDDGGRSRAELHEEIAAVVLEGLRR